VAVTKADAVVCGAGIAGIAAAHALVRDAGLRDVLLVEEGAPLALTSDKSTECYRNWWPGPGDAMVALSSRSITLMEALARATGNRPLLDRRGYLYLSADPAQGEALEAAAREAQALGAGALRVHRGGSADGYLAARADGFEEQPEGADLLLGTDRIQAHFPYVTRDAVAALHVRRAGALSAQQLGMTLLEQARERGVRLLRGRLDGVDRAAGSVAGVSVACPGGDARVETPLLVLCPGPHLAPVAALAGLALPVVCERHAKLTIDDREAVLPRHAPLSIWCDPTRLAWSNEERAALAEDPEGAALLEPFPPGVHGRPVGAGQSLILYWTYHCPVETPRFPVAWDPHYPEILLRGMSVMFPGLAAYHAHMPNPYVDGGYYTKTPENRPLVGPTPVPGLLLCAAFSGFGIMTAMGAGELLAAHVSGRALPHYAADFALSRYDDPGYLERFDTDTSGQL
jgi:glycine/D-amino acid oxidase-like deaminating enzyme